MAYISLGAIVLSIILFTILNSVQVRGVGRVYIYPESEKVKVSDIRETCALIPGDIVTEGLTIHWKNALSH